MVYDSIANKDRYKDIPQLYQGLCYLAGITRENFPRERVVLDGKRRFVVPKTYSTKDVNEAKFEVHRTQADIHYMVEGEEGVQTADHTAMTLKGEFSTERDWGEYVGEPDGCYWLRPGYFLATFPYEAHKTGIARGESRPILKAVYKYVVEE